MSANQLLITQENADGEFAIKTVTPEAGKVVGFDVDLNPTMVATAGLTNFTESNYLYNTKYGVKLTPNSAQTNVDAILQPKGTGAIIAQQPDGTAAGGNNRGANAVDLQTARALVTSAATGNCSVISGGIYNAASGPNSTVSGGATNTATNTSAVVSGGQQNTASGMYSAVSGGGGASANKYGQISHGNYKFSIVGDAQTSELLLKQQTTDATPTELFLDGSSARLTLVNSSILYCEVLIVGKTSGAITGYKYERRVCIAKGTTAASTVILGSVETIGTDYEADAGADVAITADTANGSLKIAVTGIASTTINWLALVKNIEVVKA